MKRMTALAIIFVANAWIVLSPPTTLPQEKPYTCYWEVYFSPHAGCTDAMTQGLNKVKGTILVEAISFTSAPITKGLLNAYKRSVKVEVILDKRKTTQNYSSVVFL